MNTVTLSNMAAFQYYFDISFFPQEFDSYYSKSLFDIPIDKNDKKITKQIVIKKAKYVPQIMEASTVEFKKTKFNNSTKKKRK